GVTETQDNDLRLRLDGGTDLTFHKVRYRTRDWESPYYYGGRVGYFFRDQSSWGVVAEFLHAKMYLNTADTVLVTGTDAGTRVNSRERVGDRIEAFSLSHGLNLLTADLMYRWVLGDPRRTFLGRFRPYVGAGLGAAIPHVESTLAGRHFEEYQW